MAETTDSAGNKANRDGSFHEEARKHAETILGYLDQFRVLPHEEILVPLDGGPMRKIDPDVDHFDEVDVPLRVGAGTGLRNIVPLVRLRFHEGEEPSQPDGKFIPREVTVELRMAPDPRDVFTDEADGVDKVRSEVVYEIAPDQDAPLQSRERYEDVAMLASGRWFLGPEHERLVTGYRALQGEGHQFPVHQLGGQHYEQDLGGGVPYRTAEANSTMNGVAQQLGYLDVVLNVMNDQYPQFAPYIPPALRNDQADD